MRTLLVPGRMPTFADLVTTTPARAYTFGTAGSVKSIADLSADWNPLEDFTGSFVINSEIQRYKPAFDAALFSFISGQLNMNVAAPNGWGPVIQTTATAANGNGNTAQVASTAGMSVGQMVVAQYSTYTYNWITAINGNTLTFNGPMTIANGGVVWVLPVLLAVTTAASTNSAVLTFGGGVPAGVAAGMTYGSVFDVTPNIRTVVSKTATTVTMDGPMNIGSGTTLAFLPPVYAAQMWSKFEVTPPTQGQTVALELECQIPAAAIMGAWPAFWLYSKDVGKAKDHSELDIFEFFNSDSSANAYTGYNHGPYVDDPATLKKIYERPSGTWDSFGYLRQPGKVFDAAFRKFALIWKWDRVQRYIDGELVREDGYKWTSESPAQIGINVAAGSLVSYLAGNGQFPRNSAQFPYSMGVRSLKVWTP